VQVSREQASEMTRKLRAVRSDGNDEKTRRMMAEIGLQPQQVRAGL
jgi:hypothetical protein